MEERKQVTIIGNIFGLAWSTLDLRVAKPIQMYQCGHPLTRKMIRIIGSISYFMLMTSYVSATIRSLSYTNEVGKYWTMKKGSIGPPSIYLGKKVSKVILENGNEAWAFSASQYPQYVVKNVQRHLEKLNLTFPKAITA